jgi:hypothetical protein
VPSDFCAFARHRVDVITTGLGHRQCQMLPIP